MSLYLIGGGLLVLGLFFGSRHLEKLPALVWLGVILGQVGRHSISDSSSAAILWVDLANSLYVVIGALVILLRRRQFPRRLSLIFLALSLIWLMISDIFGSRSLSALDTITMLSYALRYVLMAGTFIVTAGLLAHDIPATTVYRGFRLTGLVLIALGYIQIIFWPSFALMAQFGWDPHQSRMLATFFDPNYFGMFLVLVTSLMVAEWFNGQKNYRQAGLIALAIGAVVLTFSRSGYLSLATSLFVIFLLRSWRVVVVACLIGLTIMAAVPRVRTRVVGAVRLDPTAQDRIASWRDALRIIGDHPLIGVGYNAFGPTAVSYGLRPSLSSHAARGTDSSLLLIAATMGLPGLLLFGGFMGSLMIEALYAARRATPPRQTVALALCGAIPAYLVNSQFVNSFFYPLVLIPFAFLAALVTSEAAAPQNRRRRY